MLNKFFKPSFIFAIILLVVTISNATQDISIRKTILNGNNGGYANGKAWYSDSLKGKTSLILYTDPDKQSWAKALVDRLDKFSFNQDSLRIVFILNTKATIIPNFIIQKKLKHKAEISKKIEYVLDKEKILVKNWNLKDNNLNIIILNRSNEILYNHTGNTTQNDITQIMKILNQL